MLAKVNSRFAALRPALLALVLMLTVLAMISPATAGCTYGQTRTIIVNSFCCEYPSVKVTKQNQACCTDGTWMNQGGEYCAPYSFCAY